MSREREALKILDALISGHPVVSGDEIVMVRSIVSDLVDSREALQSLVSHFRKEAKRISQAEPLVMNGNMAAGGVYMSCAFQLSDALKNQKEG